MDKKKKLAIAGAALVAIILIVVALLIGNKKPITYNVFFETDGGSSVKSQIVEEGNQVKKPANPTRNGYTFAGWTLYEKVGTTYTKIKDIEGVETYDASADVGEKKIFVAKVYALNKSGEKVYSEYSNEYVLDNSN